MAIFVSFAHTESKEAERTSSIEEDCIANGGFIMFPLRFDCTLFYDEEQNSSSIPINELMMDLKLDCLFASI